MLPAYFLDGKYPYDVQKELESIWTIDTLEELDVLLVEFDRLEEAGIVNAVDTETNDINPKEESPAGKGVIITTQFSWIEESATMDLDELVAAIEAKEVEPTRVWVDCRNPAMLMRMKPYLQRKTALKVFQGSSFDSHEFWNHGIRVEGIDGDSLQMSRNQYPERMSHSLDGEGGLVFSLLGDKRITTMQALNVGIVKKDGTRGMRSEFRSMREYVEDLEMRPFQQVYSTFDVYDTIRLYYILKKKMMEMEWEEHASGFWGHWEEWGRPYLAVLLLMERQGVCVDEDVVDTLLVDYKRMQDELEKEIYEIIQCPANLNSSPQKAFVLFGTGTRTISGKRKGEEFQIHGMEIPCKEEVEERVDPWIKQRKWNGKMSSGNPSCDREHLEWAQIEIDDPDCDEYKVLGLMKQRNELEKLVSGTLAPLKRNLRPRHQTGLREPKAGVKYVHGNFSPATRTGRLSCVAAWTPIVTHRGFVEISDVVVGDLVKTHKNRWKRVTHTWIKGIEDMATVHFAGGNVLTCTRAHRLLRSDGSWATVGEILSECVEVVGGLPGESGSREDVVSNRRVFDDSRDRGQVRNELSKCSICDSEWDSSGGEEGIGEDQVLPIEGGGSKSDDGEVGDTTSQLKRGVRRRVWVPDHCLQGEAEICSSCRAHGSIGHRSDSQGDVSTPHRWRPDKQRVGQSGSVYALRAPSNSLPGEGQSVVEIEKIVCAGSCTVFDITVEEDESYLACGVFSHNSSLPNLQNIPTRTILGNRIRHAFIAEEGEAMIVVDYSQLELNILGWYLAHLFDDLSYAQLLRDGDIHQSTADSLGIPRRNAKAVNFGIIYGMTEYKLALQLGIPLAAAKNTLMRYYETYPAVEQYGSWAVAFAEDNGCARSMFGRYRQLRDINEVWTRGRSRGRPTSRARSDGRRAKNTPIQSSAQDIMQAAHLEIYEDEELRDYGLNVNIAVHDELVSTCQAKYAPQALARKSFIMENAVTFPEYGGVVQFPTSGHIGLTWADAKDGHLFTCPNCTGDDCRICKGEGGFTVKRAGELWVAEAA